MGTREHAPISSSNRIREIKRDLDFITRMVGMQGSDRLSRGSKRSAREAIISDAPSLIPSPAEYIRSMRSKEKMVLQMPGIDLEDISRSDDSLADVPTEAQVRAFEELNRR